MSDETTRSVAALPSLSVMPAPHALSVEPASLVIDDRELAPLNPDYLTPGLVVNGTWVVESKIGAGGMGAVYLVRNAHTNPPKHFALKLSLPGGADESEAERIERVKRCEREAGLVFVLNHPNIVKPVSFFAWPDPEGGHPCIVMPYVRGETLGLHCRKKSPTLRVILGELLRPIADALDYIHEKDIYHRDIKPSNVMVRDDGAPLLMDFGIARANAATTLTSTEVMATFEFGAPEYLRWSGSVERYAEVPFTYQGQCDLFCLGGTFFEVLTGRLPYQHVAGVGEAGGVLGPVFQNALKCFEPEVASRLNPAIPPEVDALLAKMMAREASERFQSGIEVVAAVDELLSKMATPHPSLDVPFVCPPRFRAAKAGTQSTAKRKRASSAKVAAPPLEVSVPTPPLHSLELPAPSARSAARSRRGAPSFRAPLESPEGRVFREPIESLVAPAVVRSSEDVLPTALRKAKEQLQRVRAPNERQRPLVLLLGLAVLVLLILIVALSSSKPRAAPRAESLLDGKEPPPRDVPRPVMSAVNEMGPSVTHPEVEAVAELARAPARAPGTALARRAPSNDAAQIDALLEREYGGERPVVSGAAKPGAPRRSSWVLGANADDESVASQAKTLGVPTGTEIQVRLQKPLDSRTVNSGPVVARLMRPLSLRGGVVLPTGTMVYGAASVGGAGRFDARFNRLRLLDGRELKFEGIAYDREDKKPGLRASSRMQSTQGDSPGLGETVVKGAASSLLGKVGDVDGVDVARRAGETILSHDSRTSSNSGEALLLEAPMDFTVFVLEAF